MARTTTRKPPNIAEDGAPPAEPAVPDALKRAIESLGTKSLRKELKFLCQEFPAVIHTLEGRLLVQRKDVVRYHIDTDSEDHASSEGSEPESSPAGESGGEGYTARMAKCKNCSQEFDVTSNKRGDCRWHTGEKMANYDSDFWADHNVDCHGLYDQYENDPDCAEGFMWECCNEPGDNEGCKATKHKSKSNLVVPAPPAPPPPVPALSKKRKAEKEARRRSFKRWP